MLEVLLIITRLGAGKFCAVDSTPPGEWFVDALGEYRREQLARIKRSKGKIGLERIYLVSEEHRESNPKDYVKEVKRLDSEHRKASASLLLCPLDEAKELSLAFVESRGLFLSEGSRGSVAVTGKLAVDDVGWARVYTHSADVKGLRTEYLRLLRGIRNHNWDARMREDLGLK